MPGHGIQISRTPANHPRWESHRRKETRERGTRIRWNEDDARSANRRRRAESLYQGHAAYESRAPTWEIRGSFRVRVD